jgi:hypothetical protein
MFGEKMTELIRRALKVSILVSGGITAYERKISEIEFVNC